MRHTRKTQHLNKYKINNATTTCTRWARNPHKSTTDNENWDKQTADCWAEWVSSECWLLACCWLPGKKVTSALAQCTEWIKNWKTLARPLPLCSSNNILNINKSVRAHSNSTDTRQKSVLERIRTHTHAHKYTSRRWRISCWKRRR